MCEPPLCAVQRSVCLIPTQLFRTFTHSDYVVKSVHYSWWSKSRELICLFVTLRSPSSTFSLPSAVLIDQVPKPKWIIRSLRLYSSTNSEVVAGDNSALIMDLLSKHCLRLYVLRQWLAHLPSCVRSILLFHLYTSRVPLGTGNEPILWPLLSSREYCVSFLQIWFSPQCRGLSILTRSTDGCYSRGSHSSSWAYSHYSLNLC